MATKSTHVFINDKLFISLEWQLTAATMHLFWCHLVLSGKLVMIDSNGKKNLKKKKKKKNHGEKCKLGKNTVFLYEVGSWFWRRNVQAQLVSPLRNAATSGWKLALLESTLSFLSCWRGEAGAVVSSCGPLWNKMECEEVALGRDGLTRSLNIEWNI